ncbi:hypothetical protein [uncultured Oceanicoccus sp.]|uniref:hypothetical protein n=1 Tax=uncultured Oceanicoccus sp. TaxID=1706381 RepID=UPI0030DD9FE5
MKALPLVACVALGNVIALTPLVAAPNPPIALLVVVPPEVTEVATPEPLTE